MKRRVLLATAGATTLLLMGCGTPPTPKGAGPSASAVTVLTAQERSTALRVLQTYVRGQDVGQFSASATKATMGAYLDYFGEDDVVMGRNARAGRDDIVLVAGLAGPVDTSSMHRPYGYVPVGSGAMVVMDSTGAGVSRILLLDGRRPDLARLGGSVEALDLASD
jgi:hypothetical protein